VSRKAWILFTSTSVIWGSSFLLIRVTVADLTPPALVVGRTLIGAAVLLPAALRSGALSRVRGQLPTIALLAILDVAMPQLLTAWAEQRITSSLAGILTATDPLFVALLAFCVVRSEAIGVFRSIGLLLGFVGVVALLGIDLRSQREELMGAAAVLLSALGYASAALIYKHQLPDAPALGVAVVMLAVSAVLSCVPAAVDLPHGRPSTISLLALAALGLVNTGIGYWLFYVLIDEAGAASASVITYVMPVVALVLGVVVLHEAVSAVTLTGLVLIGAGAWLATRPEAATRSATKDKYG
jgi:drug/metabolite transporter (DMT)-like permease